MGAPAAPPVPEGVGAGVAEGVTLSARRGKLKLPLALSMMFTWQMYVPGFSPVSGTSNWKATPLRSGSLTAVALTGFVS